MKIKLCREIVCPYFPLFCDPRYFPCAQFFTCLFNVSNCIEYDLILSLFDIPTFVVTNGSPGRMFKFWVAWLHVQQPNCASWHCQHVIMLDRLRHKQRTELLVRLLLS